jgi:16S rRNA C967 or C1407 C5-methylase (RsmB/RsmF family)/NOL1/NOP2/fmu family ribosome biogenesis protein
MLPIPPKLLASLQPIKGFNESAFIETHLANIPVTSLRLNGDKIPSQYSFDINPNNVVPWCPTAFYLDKRPSFIHDPLLHAGAYYVQEASSMFLQFILQSLFANETNKVVLDACAAPGGKSTLLSSFFKDGLVVANEPIAQRANILVENITKWGNNNVVITSNLPKDFEQIVGTFDMVLIDAPCSGSGLFRKDNNAIAEWSLDNVSLCVQRQKTILSQLANCINNEGYLIYSTCSFSIDENENIIDYILENFDFETVAMNPNALWGIVETESPIKKGIGYRFYPDKVKGEGFFIAVLKKTTQASSYKIKSKKIDFVSKNEQIIIDNFIEHQPNVLYFKHTNILKMFPLAFLNVLKILAAYLYIKSAGTQIGVASGNSIIPSHDIALSGFNLLDKKIVIVDKTNALHFLSKKEFSLNCNTLGWHVIVFNNLQLGWVKIMPNRFNNYYPSEWKILKPF